MYIKPCRNCPLTDKNCELKENARLALKGAGNLVTSVKIKCEKLGKMYVPGQRVWALLHRKWPEHEIENTRATVLQFNKGKSKYTLLLDEDPFEDNNSRNLFLNVEPLYLKALDEPNVKLCELCGLPESHDKCKNDIFSNNAIP